MITPTPYPFRTRPYLREKVWGGRRLVDLFSKGGDDVGEPAGLDVRVDLARGEYDPHLRKCTRGPVGTLTVVRRPSAVASRS